MASKPKELTDKEIEYVESLACDAGDEVLVRLCQQAFAGDEWARRECAHIIECIEDADEESYR